MLLVMAKYDNITGVYLAPNANKNFEGFASMVNVTWDGEKFDFIKE